MMRVNSSKQRFPAVDMTTVTHDDGKWSDTISKLIAANPVNKMCKAQVDLGNRQEFQDIVYKMHR